MPNSIQQPQPFDIVGDPVIELKDGGAVAVDREVLEEMRA